MPRDHEVFKSGAGKRKYSWLSLHTAMALLDSLGRCSPACVVPSQTRADRFSAASLRWALGDPSVFSRSFFFFGTLSLCYPSHLDLIIFSSSLYHFLLHIFLRPGISGTQRESKGEAGPPADSGLPSETWLHLLQQRPPHSGRSITPVGKGASPVILYLFPVEYFL